MTIKKVFGFDSPYYEIGNLGYNVEVVKGAIEWAKILCRTTDYVLLYKIYNNLGLVPLTQESLKFGWLKNQEVEIEMNITETYEIEITFKNMENIIDHLPTEDSLGE